MPNITNINRLIDFLDHEERHNFTFDMSQVLVPPAYSGCGTVGCIAGAAMLLSDIIPATNPDLLAMNINLLEELPQDILAEFLDVPLNVGQALTYPALIPAASYEEEITKSMAIQMLEYLKAEPNVDRALVDNKWRELFGGEEF